MSVGKNFRSVTKLKVVTDAIDLCSYTMDVCSKEQNFPKRSRWMLAEKIVSTSLEIVDHIVRGNEINVECTNDYLERRKRQSNAYGACESLLAFIAIAYTRYKLDGVSVEFWTQSIVSVEARIASWRLSDVKRYKSFAPPGLDGDEVDMAVEEIKQNEAKQNDLPF